MKNLIKMKMKIVEIITFKKMKMKKADNRNSN